MKDIFRLSRLLDSSFGSLSYCRSQTRFTFHCHDWLRDIFLTICVESIHPSICAIFPMPLTPLQEISTSMLNSKKLLFFPSNAAPFFFPSNESLMIEATKTSINFMCPWRVALRMTLKYSAVDSNTSTWSLLVQVKPLSASANPTCSSLMTFCVDIFL